MATDPMISRELMPQMILLYIDDSLSCDLNIISMIISEEMALMELEQAAITEASFVK